MGKRGTAPLIDERTFTPADLEQARELYAALVESGTPVSQARGLVAWLIVKPERRADDPASDVLRRDYRLRLKVLGRPPWANEDMGAYTASAA